MLPQGGDGALQVHRVPEDDGGYDQVEAAGTIALVFKAAVPQVALPVEEDRAGESVLSFAFVEADLDSLSQLRVFHPLQHEERPLDAAHFAQRSVQAVLARITGQLADDERGRHRAVPDGSGESQNLFPLCPHQFQIQFAPDQWSERRVVAFFSGHIEPLVGEVPDAGRKAKAQQVAESKHMIGEAGCVGIGELTVSTSGFGGSTRCSGGAFSYDPKAPWPIFTSSCRSASTGRTSISIAFASARRTTPCHALAGSAATMPAKSSLGTCTVASTNASFMSTILGIFGRTQCGSRER